MSNEMHFDGWMLLLLTNDYRQFGEWGVGITAESKLRIYGMSNE